MKHPASRRIAAALPRFALVLGAALAASASHAGTSNSNMPVTASVSSNCTISTAATAFGAYDPIVTNATAPLSGSGTVTVTCTHSAATAITLGQGANPATGSTDATPQRRMLAGSSYLSYSLYSDAGATTVWGNTPQSGLGHTGTGTATNLTVHGRVPAGQNVPAGSYTDTVVATITF